MFRHCLLDKIVMAVDWLSVLYNILTKTLQLKTTYIPAFITSLFPWVRSPGMAFYGWLLRVSQELSQVLVGTVVSSEAPFPSPHGFLKNVFCCSCRTPDSLFIEGQQKNLSDTSYGLSLFLKKLTRLGHVHQPYLPFDWLSHLIRDWNYIWNIPSLLPYYLP